MREEAAIGIDPPSVRSQPGAGGEQLPWDSARAPPLLRERRVEVRKSFTEELNGHAAQEKGKKKKKKVGEICLCVGMSASLRAEPEEEQDAPSVAPRADPGCGAFPHPGSLTH